MGTQRDPGSPPDEAAEPGGSPLDPSERTVIRPMESPPAHNPTDLGPLGIPAGFNAQHAPLGAFFSFTCGHPGTPGGLGLEIGQPADQNVFVGVKHGRRTDDAPTTALPFYADRAGLGAGAADFLGEQAVEQAGPGEQHAPQKLTPYALNQITRHYGWATDLWATGDFTFAIHTPFAPLPDPATAAPSALRDALLPAVTAELTVDNRAGRETKTAFFALGFAKPGARTLPTWTAGHNRLRRHRLGFAWRRELGVAGELHDVTDPQRPAALDAAFAFQRWTVDDGLTDTVNPVHQLGSCPGIAFEVPPGKAYTLRLALGVYREGVATTGLEGRYLYTRHYGGLNDVLDAALERAATFAQHAKQLDEDLAQSALSAHQQFMVAHATRSYHGSTQLLDIAGDPFWIVNEGEYCMMNTLDLSIDQAFWELDRNPWVVRNLLDSFTKRHAYHDMTRDAEGDEHPGGVSFCHDMGAHNQFSPPGDSSYEMAGLTGCFSFMTMEQLCNWVLLASCYVAKTNDTAWLTQQAPLLSACAESLRHRCDEHGVMRRDSARCAGGAEITTYDSLDESLGQARANTYILVKTWAAWLGLDLLHRTRTGGTLPDHHADAIAAFVPTCIDEHGLLPAVLEPDNPGFTSRILPVVEALVYPAWWLRQLNPDDPRRAPLKHALASPMTDTLKHHTRVLLTQPETRNLFADGGIKLSSTSNNSWMSKIALFLHVVRDVLHLDEDPAIAETLENADQTHVQWQAVGSAYWACSDQIISGVAKASRYYPRIVTAALWMDEHVLAPPMQASDAQSAADLTPKIRITQPVPQPK